MREVRNPRWDEDLLLIRDIFPSRGLEGIIMKECDFGTYNAERELLTSRLEPTKSPFIVKVFSLGVGILNGRMFVRIKEVRLNDRSWG
jgi:hypothetical protein